MSLLANSNAIESGGFNIDRSLRFRSSATAYLNRTPGSASNRTTWTWSGWVKLGKLGTYRQLFSAGSGATQTGINFESGDTIYLFSENGSGTSLRTSQVFRDPSAWYHIIWAVDTTQATAANRSKLYINGSQVTAFSVTQYAAQNTQSAINNNVAHYISTYDGSGWPLDGYLAEVNFIDGQALTPSSFGQTDAITGVWVPKKYTGTYGTNGFYLPFSDNTSANTLCYDMAGSSTTVSSAAYFTPTGGVSQSSINFQPSMTIANMYDGILTGQLVCSNNPVNAYIALDAGSGNTLNLTKWSFYIRNASSNETWSIQYSDNNSSWTNVTTGWSPNASGWNDSPTWASVGAHRYWRAIVTSQVNGEYYTEYRVYGTGTYRTANDWTPNNISTTAGATYDSMTDVPTLTSATAANYCTMNPLTNSSYTTLSGGNLNTSGNTSSDNGNTRSTFAVSSGKWYAEFTCTGVYSSSYPQYGIVTSTDANRPNNANPQGGGSSGLVNPTASVVYQPSGNKITSGSGSSYGSSWTTNDIIGIAVDSDNGAVYFSKNGVWQNSGVPTSGASKTGAALTWTGGAYEHVMCIAEYNGSGTATNFGQRPFSYTPPTGFVALNTFNLPDPTIKKPNQYMDASLYTGNSSTQSITNSGFQPDLVWVKSRGATGWHCITDSVRGNTSYLYSNGTVAEETGITNAVTSFNSNGFSVGANTQGTYVSGNVNYNGVTMVGWQWKESATAGFDIVTYTGTGSARTISHNLGVAPKMIFVKARSTTGEWDTYHASLPSASYYLVLNATDAQATSSGVWNATAPTSSVFSVGTSGSTNGNGTTFVAYLFAEIPQFSKAFSYTGNGSADGPMVHLGFRPKWIMVKSSSTGGAGYNWVLYDTSRSPYNVADLQLAANLSDAEAVSNQVDLLSNGFKVFGGGTRMNGSGTTYIGMAFAEFPFKFSLAR